MTQVCPECGAAVKPEHRFCSSCGRALTPSAYVPPPPAAVGRGAQPAPGGYAVRRWDAYADAPASVESTPRYGYRPYVPPAPPPQVVGAAAPAGDFPDEEDAPEPRGGGVPGLPRRKDGAAYAPLTLDVVRRLEGRRSGQGWLVAVVALATLMLLVLIGVGVALAASLQ